MKRIFLAGLMIMVCSLFVFTQEKISVVPIDEVFVTIIPQIDCPLKIEDAVAVKWGKGESDILYKVRNSGSRSIKSYTIVQWYSDNTGSITTGAMPSNGKAIEPNDFSGRLPNELLTRGIELQQEVKQKEEKIKFIAFVMIAEITFADGSKYSANKTLKSLESHLLKIEKLYYYDN